MQRRLLLPINIKPQRNCLPVNHFENSKQKNARNVSAGQVVLKGGAAAANG
jgi:hypothetical protein